MRGEKLASASLGFHGLAGDRRLAFRQLTDRSGFPWLSAGRLPALIAFTPLPREDGDTEALPTHVRTPEGAVLPLFSEALNADVGRRFGAPVELMELRQGIFDDATVSVIAAGTAAELCWLAGKDADVRRFRPNILLRTPDAVPFEEDQWVGGTLTFGEADEGPAVAVTMRDVRCSMINLDPDGGATSPEFMKAAVRANQNNAGVYGTVTRAGRLAVGQAVVLRR